MDWLFAEYLTTITIAYHEYEDCKYCEKTGFISREEYPPDCDDKMYVFNYTCKCSSGTTMKETGVPYFSKFDYDSDGRVIKGLF